MMMALKEETMATTKALSTRIEELEGGLALCRTTVEKGVSSAALSNENRMENYFSAKGIVDDAVKFYPEFTEEEARTKLQGITQRGTVGEYVREFKELMLQVSDVTEEEALLAFQNSLKSWVRQEVEQRCVQKLSEAMTVVESMVKLGLGKNKLWSFKFEESSVCEMDHKEDILDGNGNGDNGGNGKPRVGKKKLKRKRDKLKCFLCDGPHMLKKCLKKYVLKGKPVDKALVLGSRQGVSKPRRPKAKRSQWSTSCVMGLPPKEEVSLSSDLEERVSIKTVKLGPMRLKLSEASELAESSTRLPPMGDVGSASDFKEKEVMHVR
ncbi:hypothetical protein Gotur_035563 [Gossypium turneri]